MIVISLVIALVFFAIFISAILVWNSAETCGELKFHLHPDKKLIFKQKLTKNITFYTFAGGVDSPLNVLFIMHVFRGFTPLECSIFLALYFPCTWILLLVFIRPLVTNPSFRSAVWMLLHGTTISFSIVAGFEKVALVPLAQLALTIAILHAILRKAFPFKKKRKETSLINGPIDGYLEGDENDTIKEWSSLAGTSFGKR